MRFGQQYLFRKVEEKKLFRLFLNNYNLMQYAYGLTVRSANLFIRAITHRMENGLRSSTFIYG